MASAGLGFWRNSGFPERKQEVRRSAGGESNFQSVLHASHISQKKVTVTYNCRLITTATRSLSPNVISSNHKLIIKTSLVNWINRLFEKIWLITMFSNVIIHLWRIPFGSLTLFCCSNCMEKSDQYIIKDFFTLN